jgi:hypothetical protein
MLLPLKKKPEDKEKDNVFKGIHEVPWWRGWLDVLGWSTAILAMLEILHGAWAFIR